MSSPSMSAPGAAAAPRSEFECRPRCAACCIAPSISSPIPGMPVVNGVSKPAGVRCVQLDEDERCKIFGQSERPAVCSSLQPCAEMCGDSREQAMRWLGWMEEQTAPAGLPPVAP